MSKLLVIIGAVALLAILVLGVSLPKADVSQITQGPQGVQGPIGPAGPQGPKGESANISGLQSVLQALQGLVGSLQNQKLGAIPGTQAPELFCIGGSCQYSFVTGVGDATTTIFAVLNPFTGTSTATVRIYGFAATSTTEIFVGTSTSKYLVATQGASSVGVSKALINAKVATTTVVDLMSGVLGADYASGDEFLSIEKSHIFPEIVVGPTEYIAGHSSSTDSGSANNAGNRWGLSDIGARASGTVEVIFKSAQGQKK